MRTFWARLILRQDWLYDEGDDASKGQYIAKYEELRASAGPIIQRFNDRRQEEEEARRKVQEEAAAKRRADDEAKKAEEKKKAEEASKSEQKPDEEMKDADAEATTADAPEA
jgi:heat shock protein 4